MKWTNSFRAIAALIVLLLTCVVVIMGMFTQIIPQDVSSILTFLLGTVVGSYFSKRDEKKDSSKE